MRYLQFVDRKYIDKQNILNQQRIREVDTQHRNRFKMTRESNTKIIIEKKEYGKNR